MSDPLTTLLRDSVSGIPAALRPAVELRQRAEHRQRVRRAVATGVTACLLVLAVVLGGGLTGGRERALELPVKKPEHGLSVLLIADELPYRQLKFKVNTSPREKDKPVATCQRAALHTLGPRKVWQRTFSSGNAGDLDAAQVVAEFASPQEAAAAFRTIADWFTSCEGTDVRRWPPLTLARGRAEFVELTRSLPDDQKTGGVRQDIAREHISYAVSGASITIVSVSLFGFEMSDTEDSNYLEMVARAALHRLAGTRTITENALPSSFRFADEPKPRRATPQTSFENPFGVQGFLQRCDPYRGDSPLPVGMLAVQGEGDRQLTLYPDETTARVAAQAVLRKLRSCPRWTVEPVENIPGAHLASLPYNEPPGTVVLAIAQWGNSVFIGTEGHRERLAKAEVVRRAQDALTANRPVVCRVAEGCP